MLEQTGEVQGANPGAAGEGVLGEPEQGGCGGCPDAAEVEHGIAVERRGAELEAVDDGDDGGVVVEVPDDAVTSSPSCDPWMSQGC